MTFGKDVVIKGTVTVKNTSGTEKDRSAMIRVIAEPQTVKGPARSHGSNAKDILT